MRAKYAKKLHNADEVTVCTERDECGRRTRWVKGVVVGDPVINEDGIFVCIRSENGFLFAVKHTDIK